MKEVIVVFTKYPEEGKVKTRLAEEIGSLAATEIYKRLLQHTQRVLDACGKDYVVYWGNTIPQQSDYFTTALAHYLQCDGDLGDKMQHAFQDQFALGYHSVCGIGCDCFDLDSAHLAQAFDSLRQHNIVFGPAEDGGYYLLGINRFYAFLFEKMPWSTERLLKISQNKAMEQNLEYSEIEKLSDVDYFEDLPQIWKDEFRI